MEGERKGWQSRSLLISASTYQVWHVTISRTLVLSYGVFRVEFRLEGAVDRTTTVSPGCEMRVPKEKKNWCYKTGRWWLIAVGRRRASLEQLERATQTRASSDGCRYPTRLRLPTTG